VAARRPRGGDGRSVPRDRVEYSRAHRVWWFVSVYPNHAAVACPCGVLERRVVGCRTLDELRDQCLHVGCAAVEVSIRANPPRQGSARRRQASRRPRRVGPRRRRGRAELPSPRSPPASPSTTGLAQSTRWPARLPAAHPLRGGTAPLRCSGCSTRGSRFRSSRGFSCATPPWSRRARRRRDRRYRRCRIRVAPPTSLRPNSYRSAALHRAARRAARRHEARPNHRWRRRGLGSDCLSALSAECTHTFGTGLITVQSRLRRGYLETSPR
jgi:hypothetical protein